MPEEQADSATEKPAVFLLHALGGSRREFEQMGDLLAEDFDVVAIDLPGFGDAPASLGVTVEEMVDHVIGRIASHGSSRWLLVGHSMGGKIATVAASLALSGEAGVFGLAGVVLLAGSPPSPEPMDESRREQMLGWARDGGLDGDAAREFIDANVGAPLPPASDRLELDDLLRTTREAWLAWLERGSREDWSERVGTLDIPALIVAGGADGDLGPAGQREHNLPVYPRARLEVLDGAGHLLPLERPAEVADAIAAFWRDRAARGPAVPADVGAVISSDRTSARTRGILARRAVGDDPDYAPRALTVPQLATLRALAARIVPQGDASIGAATSNAPTIDRAHSDAARGDAAHIDAAHIDIAARVDQQLAAGRGDGWRHAELPTDVDAYRLALDALADFAQLSAAEQADRIGEIADGSFVPDGAELDPARLTLWFGDAKVDLVRQWLAHPATMARIGFDGFANGGDGIRLQGWQRLAAGEREAWEPSLPVRSLPIRPVRGHGDGIGMATA